MSLFTSVKDFRRLRELVGILMLYGFDDFVHWMGLENQGRLLSKLLRRELPPDARRQPTAVRARMALEEMGPTFVKLGQILATRVDIFPAEWIEEFELLQDKARPLPFSALQEQLAASLGKPIDEVFVEIDREPLGSASMAQVHRAVLQDGSEVVLKIRKPGIRAKITADLRLLKQLAEIARNQSPELRRYQPLEIVQEFERSLLRELDFSVEARAAERMAENMRGIDFIRIPRIYWEWTCEDLNVQELVRGIPAKQVQELDRQGYDRNLLAHRGAKAIWKMMLEDGYFHADPHPGNFLVLPGNVIAMLDFGMVGRLTSTRRDQLIRLIRCMLLQEPESATQVLVEWSGHGYVNKDALNAEVANLVEKFDGVPISELDVAGMLHDVAAILRNHSVRLPSDITLLVKACITLEGFGRLMAPDFQLMEEAAPLLKKTMLSRYAPKKLARAVRIRAMDMMERVYNPMPGQGSEYAPPAGIDPMTVEKWVGRLERSSARQNEAILIAALFILSGLLIQLPTGPHLWGLHVLGLMSLLITTFYGALLLMVQWWTLRGRD